MKPIIFHTGLTPPPEIKYNHFEILHTPTITVEFNHHHIPQDIIECSKSNPVAIIMSKNAVSGLKKWLEKYNISMDIFGDMPFWTVGEQTYKNFLDELGIESWHPELMTGEGIIQSLIEKNLRRILLISAYEPQQNFIEGLSTAGINFFHFHTYVTQILSNAKLTAEFIDDENNFIVCTSPSTVEGTLKSLSLIHLADLKSKLISIGPTTSSAIRERKGFVYHESGEQKIATLYSEIITMDFSHEQS